MLYYKLKGPQKHFIYPFMVFKYCNASIRLPSFLNAPFTPDVFGMKLKGLQCSEKKTINTNMKSI